MQVLYGLTKQFLALGTTFNLIEALVGRGREIKEYCRLTDFFIVVEVACGFVNCLDDVCYLLSMPLNLQGEYSIKVVPKFAFGVKDASSVEQDLTFIIDIGNVLIVV